MIKKKTEISVNEYINLKDVRGSILYSKDNYIFSFIRVQPISTALMTEDEKKFLTLSMAKELSPLQIPFKILFLSRPTDVKQIIDYYEGIKATTSNTKKRDNITKTMRFFSSMANSGGVLERQTYISIWMNLSEKTEEDLNSKAIEFAMALEKTGVPAEICREQEIIGMLGLFYNPLYQSGVIYDTTPNFTFMEG